MGFLGDLFDGGAKEAQQKNEATAASLQSLLGEQYGFGMGKLLEGLTGIEESYLKAKGALSGAGLTATNQILEQGKQTLAATSQDLISAGLGSTTVKGNAAAQIQKMTSTSLAGLAEKLGGLHAGVETQFGAQKQQALSGIADFAMKKVGAAADIAPQYEAIGGGLAPFLGQAIGSYVGGSILPGIGGALGGLFGKKDKEG